MLWEEIPCSTSNFVLYSADVNFLTDFGQKCIYHKPDLHGVGFIEKSGCSEIGKVLDEIEEERVLEDMQVLELIVDEVLNLVVFLHRILTV